MLRGSSPEPVIVQARVTLEETVQIPAFSEMEVTARVDKPVCGGTWFLEGDKSGRLAVSVANALVNPATSYVPLRVLNMQPESVVVFKGTKMGVVERTDGIAQTVQVATVEPATGEAAEVSEARREMLWKMVEECGEELTLEQKQQFFLLLLANADVFADDDNPGRTNVVKHRVDTGNSPPTRQPVRRIPAHKREEARHLLQDMLAKGVIQPSCSPWASPIVLVPKKDGSVGFCIDYRKVNASQPD